MKQLDHKISKWIYDRTHASPVLTLLAKAGATYAILVTVMMAFVIFWRDRPLALEFFFILLFTWCVTFLLQLIVRRKRPFECAIYESKVKLFCKTPSFPSTHSSIAFAVASSVFWVYPAFAPIFFLLALWIALSRIAVGVHYFFDVVVGMVVGLFVPWIVFAVLNSGV